MGQVSDRPGRRAEPACLRRRRTRDRARATTASLDRRQRRLRAGLRPDELRRQRRVRPDRQSGVRAAVPAFRWDDNGAQGWGVREYSNQWTVSAAAGAAAGIRRRGRLLPHGVPQQQVAVNTAVTRRRSIYYCVTAPTDPRLGTTSGQQVCGILRPESGRHWPNSAAYRDRRRRATSATLNGRVQRRRCRLQLAVGATVCSSGRPVRWGARSIDDCFANELPAGHAAGSRRVADEAGATRLPARRPSSARARRSGGTASGRR